MDLTRLRYFVAVADELHFGRAAARLHMAQPPLSRQIRRLETDLGTDLFTRTTRKVELTPAGALLHNEAVRLLAQADQVHRLMSQHRSGDVALLRIGFVDSASYAVMPKFLRAHRERWPQVRYELHTLSSEAQQAAFTAGDIDLGIARAASASNLDQRVILDEPLFVALPVQHRLAGQKSTSFRDLAGEGFISFTRADSPTLTEHLRASLALVDVDYDPVIEAEEYTTILGLVAAGEGIAIVPDTVRSFQPEGLIYTPLRDPQARTQLLMLSRRDSRLPAVARALALADELYFRTSVRAADRSWSAAGRR